MSQPTTNAVAVTPSTGDLSGVPPTLSGGSSFLLEPTGQLVAASAALFTATIGVGAASGPTPSGAFAADDAGVHVIDLGADVTAVGNTPWNTVVLLSDGPWQPDGTAGYGEQPDIGFEQSDVFGTAVAESLRGWIFAL